MGALAARLLMRGDSIAIGQGRLTILPASGIPVPDEWMTENHDPLVLDILHSTGIDALRYVGYSTGLYEVAPKVKRSGVRLHLVSLATDEDVTAFFNADIYRARDTKGGKAGAPLPKGEFRVGERSAFYKFWLSTGLKMPERLQRFNRQMGTLRHVLLTGELAGGRVSAATLKPLTISADAVSLGVAGHNSDTIQTQLGHNSDTSLGHKETPRTHTPQGLQPIPTACAPSCVDKYTSRHVYKGEESNPLPDTKPPQEQTDEEWWASHSTYQEGRI